MSDQFVPVTETTAVDHLIEQSHSAPVLVFKHDPYCSISMVAHRQLTQLEQSIPTVDVAHDKAVASEVTARTGVKHESPQVIVLRDGQAVWSASHYAITAAAVEKSMREHS